MLYLNTHLNFLVNNLDNKVPHEICRKMVRKYKKYISRHDSVESEDGCKKEKKSF